MELFPQSNFPVLTHSSFNRWRPSILKTISTYSPFCPSASLLLPAFWCHFRCVLLIIPPSLTNNHRKIPNSIILQRDENFLTEKYAVFERKCQLSSYNCSYHSPQDLRAKHHRSKVTIESEENKCQPILLFCYICHLYFNHKYLNIFSGCELHKCTMNCHRSQLHFHNIFVISFS